VRPLRFALHGDEIDEIQERNVGFQVRLLVSNAVVASFDTLLPATVEEAVANVEISKEKETAQTRARAPGS